MYYLILLLQFKAEFVNPKPCVTDPKVTTFTQKGEDVTNKSHYLCLGCLGCALFFFSHLFTEYKMGYADVLTGSNQMSLQYFTVNWSDDAH